MKKSEYYKKNKEKIKEKYDPQKRKEKYEQNKEGIREKRKEKYQQNKEKIKEKVNEYRKKNKKIGNSLRTLNDLQNYYQQWCIKNNLQP